ncbi:MAG: MFS transporter, partial [Clostridia bacterium]
MFARKDRSVSQGPVHQWGLAAYWFSLNFQGAALITIVVPEMLTRLHNVGRTMELARIAALAAFVAMVVPPLVGMVSDRLRARGLPRRSLLIAGTAVNMGGLLAASQANSVEALAGLIVIALVGQGAATASYQAMLPEVVPRERWGAASGYMAVASLAGTVAGLATAGLGSIDTAYWGMVGTAGAGALYTTVTVLEPARVVDSRVHVNVRDWRRFRWVFAARFMVILAQTLLMTFVLYFFEEVLHVRRAAGGTALLGTLALVGAGLSAFWMGRASDRRDRALVVAWAGVPMAVAVTGFGLWPNPHLIFALAILWGLGYGAFLSVDWALALDSIPDLANVARDLGIWGIASNLPAVAAPLLGGFILARYVNPEAGYRVLFMTAGMAFLVGSLLVARVRETTPRMSAGAWVLAFLIAGILKVYVALAYRVRWSGALPKDRRGLLLVANHIHDLEGMTIPSGLFWRDP